MFSYGEQILVEIQQMIPTSSLLILKPVNILFPYVIAEEPPYTEIQFFECIENGVLFPSDAVLYNSNRKEKTWQ